MVSQKPSAYWTWNQILQQEWLTVQCTSIEEEERMVGLCRCSTTFPSSLWTCLWSTPWLVGGTSARTQEDRVTTLRGVTDGHEGRVKQSFQPWPLPEKKSHSNWQANPRYRIKWEQFNLHSSIGKMGTYRGRERTSRGHVESKKEEEAKVILAKSSIWGCLPRCNDCFLTKDEKPSAIPSKLVT